MVKSDFRGKAPKGGYQVYSVYLITTLSISPKYLNFPFKLRFLWISTKMWIQRIHFEGVPRLFANISRGGRNFYYIFSYTYFLGDRVCGTTIDIEEVRSLTGKRPGVTRPSLFGLMPVSLTAPALDLSAVLILITHKNLKGCLNCLFPAIHPAQPQ